MADILAAPQQAVSKQADKDEQFRTLGAISAAHWVSHFHIFVLPMLFPFLKQQLNVGYVELGFALTVFAVSSGLTQAPIGYLADHHRRAKNSADGPLPRRRRVDRARPAPELFVADRERRRIGAGQQRLSPRQLCDPFGAYE